MLHFTLLNCTATVDISKPWTATSCYVPVRTEFDFIFFNSALLSCLYKTWNEEKMLSCSFQTTDLQFSCRLPLSFIITPLLSSIIHLFSQSTRLVSKTSSPAWPLLSLSTAALTPSPVGSLILSEGTLQGNILLFSPRSVSLNQVQIFLFWFIYLCVCVGWVLVCSFLFVFFLLFLNHLTHFSADAWIFCLY